MSSVRLPVLASLVLVTGLAGCAATPADDATGVSEAAWSTRPTAPPGLDRLGLACGLVARTYSFHAARSVRAYFDDCAFVPQDIETFAGLLDDAAKLAADVADCSARLRRIAQCPANPRTAYSIRCISRVAAHTPVWSPPSGARDGSCWTAESGALSALVELEATRNACGLALRETQRDWQNGCLDNPASVLPEAARFDADAASLLSSIQQAPSLCAPKAPGACDVPLE